MTYNVFSGTLNPTQSTQSLLCCLWDKTFESLEIFIHFVKIVSNTQIQIMIEKNSV